MKAILRALRGCQIVMSIKLASPLTSTKSRQLFDVQKARMMARFSYMAYEDPPLSLHTVERFIDDFGVTITKPLRKQENRSTAALHTAQKIDLWEMAHVNACSPRPLNLMMSGCAATPTLQDDGIDLSNSATTFQWVALASNERTGAQLDAWRIDINQNSLEKKSENILVVAFRGTRLNTIIDLLTDIQLQQKMVSCSDFVCKLRDDLYDGSEDEIMVHSGFLKAYSSIRSSLLQLIAINSDVDRIWLTGHSLGGALATLAAVDIGSIMQSQLVIKTATAARTNESFTIPPLEISSYVFGTPRVGNTAFAYRLKLLQQTNIRKEMEDPILTEYFRVNAAGDAVVFLPRGKDVNRLGIDYTHVGATVILPSIVAPTQSKGEAWTAKSMMELEEEIVDRINNFILRPAQGDETDVDDDKSLLLNKIRIYQNADTAPDPLAEINPDYKGFFPFNNLHVLGTKSFQKFALGEVVRSFRILRGGFNIEHRIANYEKILCSISQDDVVFV